MYTRQTIIAGIIVLWILVGSAVAFWIHVMIHGQDGDEGIPYSIRFLEHVIVPIFWPVFLIWFKVYWYINRDKWKNHEQ